MEIIDEEEPGETAEEVAKKQDVMISRMGQSYTFTIEARCVLEYGPHSGCPGCKYIILEVARPSLATARSRS